MRGFAPQLLVLILGKRDMQYISDRKGKKGQYQCVNCDRITMTYIELEKLGITHPRVVRAKDDILAKGFVEIVSPGGTYQKDKTIFRLIEQWRLWVPGQVFNKRKRDVKRGYQGQKARSKLKVTNEKKPVVCKCGWRGGVVECKRSVVQNRAVYYCPECGFTVSSRESKFSTHENVPIHTHENVP